MNTQMQIQMLDQMWDNFFALRHAGTLDLSMSDFLESMSRAYERLGSTTPNNRK